MIQMVQLFLSVFRLIHSTNEYYDAQDSVYSVFHIEDDAVFMSKDLLLNYSTDIIFPKRDISDIHFKRDKEWMPEGEGNEATEIHLKDGSRILLRPSTDLPPSIVDDYLHAFGIGLMFTSKRGRRLKKIIIVATVVLPLIFFIGLI